MFIWTDTISFHNIELSSWISLCKRTDEYDKDLHHNKDVRLYLKYFKVFKIRNCMKWRKFYIFKYRTVHFIVL